MLNPFFWAIPTWIAFLILRTILILLGWIIVPIAALCKAYEAYDGHDGAGNFRIQYRFTWRWIWLWGNDEDGIADATYKQFDSMFMRIIYWSCLRNPANNLRFVPFLSCKIDPDNVLFIGTYGSNPELILEYNKKVPLWYFAWDGWYSNYCHLFKWRNGLWKFWIGWKIYPDDITGVTPYRINGAGFATQFKKVLDYDKS
jgi:hypothetical protein